MVRSMGLDVTKLSASMTSARDQYDSDISQIKLDQFAAMLQQIMQDLLNLLYHVRFLNLLSHLRLSSKIH